MKNGQRILHEEIIATVLCSDDGARALVADHGAHVLSWVPANGKEALFLSTASGYGGDTAIRGGVPIIFPQFAELGTGRRHGFARILPWQLLNASIDQNGAAIAHWRLQGLLDGATGVNANRYCLDFYVCVIADTIEFGLTIGNTGTSQWQCNAALHTYLKVDDLAASSLGSLQGFAYEDKTLPCTSTVYQNEAQIQFDAERDRIYRQAPPSVQLLEPGRSVTVKQTGFNNIVVWNPGAEKGARLNDLPKDGFQGFICVEAAAIMPCLTLTPGMSWRGTQQLRFGT